MHRVTAACYHLLATIFLLALPAYFIRYQWYPEFFFTIDGGWQGLRLLVGVSIILGPVLTLSIFKSNKPGLRFDLTIIALVQVASLLVGMWVIYSQRPLFFVFYEKTFYSCDADTYTRFGLQAPDPLNYADSLPAMVAARVPDNPIEEAGFRRILYQDQIPVWAYQQTYQKLDAFMPQVITDGIPRQQLRNLDIDGNLDIWLVQHGGSFQDYAFIPIHARYGNTFIGVRKADHQMIDILEVPVASEH